MKTLIRMLLCLLCLCLLMAFFAACTGEPGTPDATGSAESSGPDETTGEGEPTGDVTSGEEKPDPTPTEEELQLGDLTPGDGSGEHDNDQNWTDNY